MTAAAGHAAGQIASVGEPRRARAMRSGAQELEPTAPGYSSPCGETPRRLQDDGKAAAARVEHGGSARISGGTLL
jgi:hypothetical protein